MGAFFLAIALLASFISGNELVQLRRKAEAPSAIQLWQDSSMLRNQSRPPQLLEKRAIEEADELIYDVVSESKPKVVKINVPHNSVAYVLSIGKCVVAVNSAFSDLVSTGLLLDEATRVCDRKNDAYNWRACTGGVNSAVSELAEATANLAYAPSFCGVMQIIDSFCGGDWASLAANTISIVGNAFEESVDCVPAGCGRRRRKHRSRVREISDLAQKLPASTDEATFSRWWSSVTQAFGERQEQQVANRSAGWSRVRRDDVAESAATTAARRLKMPWQEVVNRALACANTANEMGNVIAGALFNTWSTSRSCRGDLISKAATTCAANFLNVATTLPALTDKVGFLVATCPKKSFPKAACASEVADQAQGLMDIGAVGASLSADCRGEPGWPSR